MLASTNLVVPTKDAPEPKAPEKIEVTLVLDCKDDPEMARLKEKIAQLEAHNAAITSQNEHLKIKFDALNAPRVAKKLQENAMIGDNEECLKLENARLERALAKTKEENERLKAALKETEARAQTAEAAFQKLKKQTAPIVEHVLKAMPKRAPKEQIKAFEKQMAERKKPPLRRSSSHKSSTLKEFQKTIFTRVQSLKGRTKTVSDAKVEQPATPNGVAANKKPTTHSRGISRQLGSIFSLRREVIPPAAEPTVELEKDYYSGNDIWR